LKKQERERASIFCDKYFELEGEPGKKRIEESLRAAEDMQVISSNGIQGSVSEVYGGVGIKSAFLDEEKKIISHLDYLTTNRKKVINDYEEKENVDLSKLGKFKEGSKRLALKLLFLSPKALKKGNNPDSLIFSPKLIKLAVHEDKKTPEMVAKYQEDLKKADALLESFNFPLGDYSQTAKPRDSKDISDPYPVKVEDEVGRLPSSVDAAKADSRMAKGVIDVKPSSLHRNLIAQMVHAADSDALQTEASLNIVKPLATPRVKKAFLKRGSYRS
jgi:hypothetical protein